MKMTRLSLAIASSAVFGALASVLAALPLSFPFPVIPYLKFDVAEIPVFLAFLGFGPIPGFISALTYWGILNLVGEFVPIGPAMKFLAVVSTLTGIWAGLRLSRSYRLGVPLCFTLGITLRVLVMTLANYVVLVILFPEFLEFAAYMVSHSLGVQLEAGLSALILVLVFTAIYNALHVFLSLVPSIFLLNFMIRDGLFLSFARPWFYARIKRKG